MIVAGFRMRYKYDALSALRYERARDKPWTPEDVQKFDKIYDGKGIHPTLGKWTNKPV